MNNREKLIEAAKLIREHCDHCFDCEECPLLMDWAGICGVKGSIPSGWVIQGDDINDADN